MKKVHYWLLQKYFYLHVSCTLLLSRNEPLYICPSVWFECPRWDLLYLFLADTWSPAPLAYVPCERGPRQRPSASVQTPRPLHLRVGRLEVGVGHACGGGVAVGHTLRNWILVIWVHLQCDSVGRVPWLGWLRFVMLCHAAWAVGSFNSCQPAGGLMSTQPR